MTRKRHRRSPRRVAGALALLALVILLVAVAAGLAYRSYYVGPTNTVAAGQPVQVTIAAGTSTPEIAQQLFEAGVIGNSRRFLRSVRGAGNSAELKAGTYDLVTGMPDDVVIDALVQGPIANCTKVTIPEGFTVRQIAARLEKETGISSAEFFRLAEKGAEKFSAGHPYLAGVYGGSLQGFLFPKTYEIKEGATAAEVIEMMLDQFDKETESVDVALAQKRGYDLNELVTIASLVETEAKVEKDRRLISSVIHNRLRRDMRLQVDATVQYVLPTRKLRLTYQDLKVESPYNTYLHQGLPPGPICNPGLASLQAAAQPADTHYLYYVLTGKDGSHTFATNAKDFARAQQKSLEVFGR